jgi:hypothetical protein
MTFTNNRIIDSFHDALYRRFAASSYVSGGGSTSVADWRFYGPSRIADSMMGNGIYCTYMNNASHNSAVQSDVPNPAWGDPCSDRLGYDGAGRLIGKRYSLVCTSSSSSSSMSSSESSSSLSSSSSSATWSYLYVPCNPPSSSMSGPSQSSESSGSSGSSG